MSIKRIKAENTENYIVTAEADGFHYTLDHKSRNPNHQSVGTSPTGLLLSSLAGCQLMTARSYFNRQKIDVSVLKVDIAGDFNYSDKGWKLEADAVIRIDIDLEEQQVEDLKKFIDRYCTVSGILTSGNTVNLSVEKISRN